VHSHFFLPVVDSCADPSPLDVPRSAPSEPSFPTDFHPRVRPRLRQRSVVAQQNATHRSLILRPRQEQSSHQCFVLACFFLASGSSSRASLRDFLTAWISPFGHRLVSGLCRSLSAARLHWWRRQGRCAARSFLCAAILGLLQVEFGPFLSYRIKKLEFFGFNCSYLVVF
jgi:hypothetical protein